MVRKPHKRKGLYSECPHNFKDASHCYWSSPRRIYGIYEASAVIDYMAGVEQSLADAQKAQSTPSGGGEASSSQNLKAGSNPEGRTVTIDESQVEEVFPEVGDHTTDIDRSKLRPVKGRAPTPIPSEEEWNIMQKEIQQLATGGAGEQKQQYGGQQREKPQQEPAEQMPQTCLWATSKTSGQKQ